MDCPRGRGGGVCHGGQTRHCVLCTWAGLAFLLGQLPQETCNQPMRAHLAAGAACLLPAHHWHKL